MKLTSANFDAYRSLVDEFIPLEHDCVGCVGIIESGKSNLLKGLSCLAGTRTLNAIAKTTELFC